MRRLPEPGPSTWGIKNGERVLHHVTAIVGDHGTHWRHFPIVARQGVDRLIFFFDHRHQPQERQNFMRRYVRISAITRMDVLSLDSPRQCSEDVHLWQPVLVDGAMAAARCARCARTDWLEDRLAADLTLRYELAGVG